MTMIIEFSDYQKLRLCSVWTLLTIIKYQFFQIFILLLLKKKFGSTSTLLFCPRFEIITSSVVDNLYFIVLIFFTYRANARGLPPAVEY